MKYLRFVFLFSLMALAQGMAARPFWNDVTDGTHKYSREGNDAYATIYLSAHSTDEQGHSYALFLERCEGKPGWRTIVNTSEQAPRLQPPPGYTPGDSVCCLGDTFLFFNSAGELYSSMVPCPSDLEPADVLHNSRFNFVAGLFAASQNRLFSIGYHDGKPCVDITGNKKNEVVYEPFTFAPDVPQQGGPALFHLVGEKHQWLVGLTPEGLNVYAVGGTAGKVQRGRLLMTTRLQVPHHNAGRHRYDYLQRFALPHVLRAHCSPALRDSLLKELGPDDSDDYSSIRNILKLFF